MEVRDLIRQICRGGDIEILAGHVRPDHVHLLLSVPPHLAPSPVMQAIKGKTSIADESARAAQGVLGPAPVVAASGRGGGVYMAGGTVQCCHFEGNGSGGSVPGLGGGLYVDNATIANCVIRENWASDFSGVPGAGGGVATPDGTVTRCRIIGNRAGIGAGVYADCPLFSVYLTACTIAGNFASITGGGLAVVCDKRQADVVAHLCIIWSNGDCGIPDIMLDGAETTVLLICSLLDPESVAGTGAPDIGQNCMFEDPQFCDPECAGNPPFSDGYDLHATSPARAQNNSCGQHMGASHEVCEVASAGEAAAPQARSLGRPAPNPAATATRMVLAGTLPEGARVQVYDVGGRLVRTLLDASDYSAAGGGTRSITWDLRDASGTRVPNGVYFVRLHSAGREENQPLVVAP